MCGDNGKTYGNKCKLSIASCNLGRDIQVKHSGMCEQGDYGSHLLN